MSIRALLSSTLRRISPRTTPPLSPVIPRISPSVSRVTTPGTEHGFNNAGIDYFDPAKSGSVGTSHTTGTATSDFKSHMLQQSSITLPTVTAETLQKFLIESPLVHVGSYSTNKPGMNSDELEACRVFIRENKLINKSGQLANGSYLYVLSPEGNLYLHRDNGVYSHGSFLRDATGAFKPVLCAGIIIIKDEKVGVISNRSGHYKPGSGAVNSLAKLLQPAALRFPKPIAVSVEPGS